jgi:manganese efflux pump family protein
VGGARARFCCYDRPVTFGAIFVLALGLAMDAGAVSAARGVATPRISSRHVVLVAVFFGGFQAFMPLLGWAVGSRVGPIVQAWDHWIAFALLSVIGGKMLWEAGDAKPALAAQPPVGDLFGLRVMLLLAVATSLDALAVGLTLPMLNAPLLLSLATIGTTTALLSVAGLFAGRHFGGLLGKRLDLVGGLVLIGLGTKILIEHLFAP